MTTETGRGPARTGSGPVAGLPILLAATLVALAGLVPAADGRLPRHAAEARFSEGVSEERLRQTVRELVAFGARMGGTPSGDRAAAHVQAAFKQMGLDHRVEEDPPVLAHWADSWHVELLPGGRLETAWPYGFSPTSDETTAPLLVVGESDAAGPAWAGRVVYTTSHPSRLYARLADTPHLPAAILTSFPADPGRYEDWASIHHLPARRDNPVPVFALSFNEGRRVEAAAAAGVAVRFALQATVQAGRPRTVVATLTGHDAGGYYLVSAHGDSDSGGPGAEDNASGVSAVVEMARRLADLAADGIRPRSSIHFVIWGTEYHSARAYIEREGEDLGGCLGVINLDMVGSGAERETIYFESNDVPWNAPLLRTLEQVGEDYLGQPGFWSEYTTNPSQGGTDSYAFLPRKYGGRGDTLLRIPAITVYTAAWDRPRVLTQTAGWESKGLPDPASVPIDYSRYYHSSGDIPENTTERTPQHMVRAVKAVGLALLRLAY